MEELVKLIYNNGIGLVCIAYFMYRDYKFVSKINETLAIVESYITLREKTLKGENDIND